MLDQTKSLFIIVTRFDDPDFETGLCVFDSLAKAQRALADIQARDEMHKGGFAWSEIEERPLNCYGVSVENGGEEPTSDWVDLNS